MSESRYVISCKTSDEIWLYLVLQDDVWGWTQNMDEVTQFLDVDTASQIWEEINPEVPHENIDEKTLAIRKIIFHKATNIAFSPVEEINQDEEVSQEEEMLDESNDDIATDEVLSRILPEYEEFDEPEDDFIDELLEETPYAENETEEFVAPDEQEEIQENENTGEDVMEPVTPSDDANQTEQNEFTENVVEEVSSDAEANGETDTTLTDNVAESVQEEQIEPQEVKKTYEDMTATEPVVETEKCNEVTDETNEQIAEDTATDKKETNQSVDNMINIKALSQGFVDFLDSIDKSNVMETLEKLKGLVDQEVTQMKKKIDTEDTEKDINDDTKIEPEPETVEKEEGEYDKERYNEETDDIVTEDEEANHPENAQKEQATSEILSEIEEALTLSEEESVQQEAKPVYTQAEQKNDVQENGFNRRKKRKRKKKKSGRWAFG